MFPARGERRRRRPDPPAELRAGAKPVDAEVEINPDEITVDDLRKIIDEKLLTAINQPETRAGRPPFRFVIVDDLEKGVPVRAIGWTDLETREIYWAKSAVVRKMKEGGMGRRALRGLARHEGGHHAPEVWEVTEMLLSDIGNVDLEPPELEELFADETPVKARGEGGIIEMTTAGALKRDAYWRAVFSDCFNGALDFLLEQYATRGASNTQAKLDLRALHGESIAGRDFEPIALTDGPDGAYMHHGFWERLPRHHQLTQWIVGEQQYFRVDEKMSPSARKRILIDMAREHLHPDVAEVVVSLIRRNVFTALGDMNTYTSWQSGPEEYPRERKRKHDLIMQHLYPAWVKLFMLEYDEEKERREKEKQEAGEGEGEPGEDGQPGLSDGQKKQIADDVINELLGETKKLGDDAFGSDTFIPDQDADVEKAFGRVRGQGTGRGKAKPKAGEPQEPERDPLAEERARRRQRMRELERKTITDLADRYGVDQESIRELERIEREYGGVIEMLAEQIAEVFLQQRRPVTEYKRREGMLTPGMEHVLVGGVLRGNHDMDIYEQIRQATEFMQTEFEALLDTSGSMQNNRLEMGRTMVIVITQAFMEVKRRLEDEGLLDPATEEPLRTGIAFFADTPKRLKKQSDPNDPMWLARMIKQSKEFTGGTDDAAALDALNSEFSQGEDRVLKFMTVVSDGEGNPKGMQDILKQVEGDDQMFVIIIAMGSDPAAVARTYRSAARDAGAANVYVLEGNDIRQNVTDLANYMIGHVQEKAEDMAG